MLKYTSNDIQEVVDCLCEGKLKWKRALLYDMAVLQFSQDLNSQGLVSSHTI